MKKLYRTKNCYIYLGTVQGREYTAEFDSNLTASELREAIRAYNIACHKAIEQEEHERYLCSIGPEKPNYFGLKQAISKLMAIHGHDKILDIMFNIPDSEMDYDVDHLDCIKNRLISYYDTKAGVQNEQSRH